MTKPYKDEVLGHDVVILFSVDDNGTIQPFLGQIRAMKVQLKDNGKRETFHLVCFDDGDERWFRLLVEEKAKRLTWVNGLYTTVHPTKREKVACNSLPSERKRKQQSFEKHGLSEEPNCKYPRKNEKASVVSGETVKKEKCPPEAQWLNRMHHFLMCIPHGSRKRIITPSKAQSVMQMVTSLASSKGLFHGLSGTHIFAGRKIDLSNDLEELIEVAKTYGSSYDCL